MVRKDDEPPSWADEAGGLEEDGVKGIHFAVYCDAEALENTGQDFWSLCVPWLEEWRKRIS
jgi:hypothetical protein